MGQQRYFEQALANFTFETACGGAIRHLADHGYTVKQIVEKLDYPASFEQVQAAVYEHFCDSGVLLMEAPEYDTAAEQSDFVLEYDRFGKASFRRVTVKKERKKLQWRESRFLSGGSDALSRLLTQKISENGASKSYISCDFGLWDENKRLALDTLDARQQEYVNGIPWEPVRMYHQLNPRMREIAERLYRDMQYSGVCYFLNTGEKIIIV